MAAETGLHVNKAKTILEEIPEQENTKKLFYTSGIEEGVLKIALTYEDDLPGPVSNFKLNTYIEKVNLFCKNQS